MKNPSKMNRSIEQQIKKLLLTVLPVMCAIIFLLIIMLVTINSQYTGVLQNAVTAADFNQEFKTMLDSGMYNHVILPRSEEAVEQLPMDVLNDAEAVLHHGQLVAGFSVPAMEETAAAYGLKVLAQLPIDPAIAKACDNGKAEEIVLPEIDKCSAEIENILK